MEQQPQQLEKLSFDDYEDSPESSPTSSESPSIKAPVGKTIRQVIPHGSHSRGPSQTELGEAIGRRAGSWQRRVRIDGTPVIIDVPLNEEDGPSRYTRSRLLSLDERGDLGNEREDGRVLKG